MTGMMDPNAAINMAQSERANLMNYQNSNYNAQAQMASGTMQAGGSILGALALFCWVAREVYGEDDPRWKLFRVWLMTCAPMWFFKLYFKHGEAFAKWIHNKPVLKWGIRKWMDSRIAELEGGLKHA